MKKNKILLFLLLTSFSFLFTHESIANNIQVSTPRFTGYNSADQIVRIKCDVSWENSWRDSTNYDAAWLFVKYRINNGDWHHAKLSNNLADFSVPTGTTLLTVPDGSGVFIHRTNNASNSNFVVSDLELNWPYSNNNVPNDVNLEVKVFALEMVYIPQGPFYIGNGAVASGSSFYVSGATNLPYEINSESLIVIDNVPPTPLIQSNLGVTNGLWASGFIGNATTDPYDTVSSLFPKGFNAFFSMKYEITQSGYVDFLNTLTYSQQASRTISSPSSAAGTAALLLNNSNRNGIDIMVSGIAPNQRAIYACNLDDDNNFNELNDGAFIACNGLSWADVGAYLDWAALRPMSEFEFEKICRGPNLPIHHEYAWGDSSLSVTTYGNGGLDNPGMPNETIKNNNYGSLGNAAMQSTMTNFSSPMRVGIFASHPINNNNRRLSGASYYGVMEMTGNVLERCVTIFNKPFGRTYTGAHGDGVLSQDGHFNVLNWPGNDANGISFRGGSFNFSTTIGRVSNRSFTSPVSPIRYLYAGGRGIRTAP